MNYKRDNFFYYYYSFVNLYLIDREISAFRPGSSDRMKNPPFLTRFGYWTRSIDRILAKKNSLRKSVPGPKPESLGYWTRIIHTGEHGILRIKNLLFYHLINYSKNMYYFLKKA